MLQTNGWKHVFVERRLKFWRHRDVIITGSALFQTSVPLPYCGSGVPDSHCTLASNLLRSVGETLLWAMQIEVFCILAYRREIIGWPATEHPQRSIECAQCLSSFDSLDSRGAAFLGTRKKYFTGNLLCCSHDITWMLLRSKNAKDSFRMGFNYCAFLKWNLSSTTFHRNPFK